MIIKFTNKMVFTKNNGVVYQVLENELETGCWIVQEVFRGGGRRKVEHSFVMGGLSFDFNTANVMHKEVIEYIDSVMAEALANKLLQSPELV